MQNLNPCCVSQKKESPRSESIDATQQYVYGQDTMANANKQY